MAKRRVSTEPHIPKYQRVIETLAGEIRSGKYPPGGKLPSEAALVQQFQTSRITVGRALRELTANGMILRIAGSGSYVQPQRSAADGLVFGLLIPDLGHSEVFTPICQGIANAPAASRHALLWGHTAPDAASAADLAKKLSGVK